LGIHWVFLYHLDNWERDLINTLEVSRIVSLESEELTSRESEDVIKYPEYGAD
tara:strand:- start:263 stop:421 length:159 start_codon:yes stop_codon:yes gene_type:complete